MAGFIDLHCHFVAGIDDGARSPEEGVRLLGALKAAGFEKVVATPHMRPGLFDNTALDLERAYARMLPALSTADVPEVALSSEHYFDDVVFQRILDGKALPYPGGRAVLLEFYEIDFPPSLAARLFDLRRRRILPVIAHPERYRCLWSSSDRLEPLVDAGAAALLDVAALVGKYGKQAERTARRMLDEGLYAAACSDAHRVEDVGQVARGIEVLERRYGQDEVDELLRTGPVRILAGKVDA